MAKKKEETRQCAATSKAGTRCKRKAVGRSKYCTIHMKKK